MNRSGGRSDIHFPSHARQTRLLGPKFQDLVHAFAQHRAELRLDPGIEPEKVLVLETVDGVDEFMRAVARIPGMEWLGEWDEEGIPADDDFYSERDPERPLRGRVYLMMFNQRALDELVSLWNRYRRNPNQQFPRGLNRWREVFGRLRNIRYWNETDRVDPGLARFWETQLAAHRNTVVVKVELWFSTNEQKRVQSQRVVEELLREQGGRLLGQAVIPEITFHAIAAEIPAQSARRLIDLEQTRLAVCDRVMFFRPLGQCAAPFPTDQVAGNVAAREPVRPASNIPVVALLDGLPATNHTLLSERIILDDPDGWSADYQARDRVHGTMMASIIAHGDLSANEPALSTPIYARPIFKPDRSDWRGTAVECIPESVIAEDLIHRSVRRLFDGEAGGNPVAPSVRIVSLAIGDPLLLFERTLSPLAKLIDWLSWKYRILFLVSAGNHTADLELGIPRGNLARMNPQEIERTTLLAVEANSFDRRLLCPAEAVNALTVGAVHSDSSVIGPLAQRINPFQAHSLPSPINAVGLGYRRSVKPDLLFSGGRQLFREKMGNIHNNETLQVLAASTSAPGHRAASPGPPGNLSATRFFCGTSNATAIGVRKAAELHDLLGILRTQPGGSALDDAHEGVILKAMLVHGCSWDEPMSIMEPILGGLPGRPPIREYAARFLGYGPSETQRLFSCTQQRATLIGCGDLSDGQAHIYSVPLPPSLSAQLVWRRLTVTLAWLTPTHPSHRAYRRAALWFSPPEEELLVRRSQVDWQMVQRGTVQHEILEGEQATAFVDGRFLAVQVNCRGLTGSLDEEIPYAIAVSLEVADGVTIPIYDEIRARIRVGIPIEARNPNE